MTEFSKVANLPDRLSECVIATTPILDGSELVGHASAAITWSTCIGNRAVVLGFEPDGETLARIRMGFEEQGPGRTEVGLHVSSLAIAETFNNMGTTSGRDVPGGDKLGASGLAVSPFEDRPDLRTPRLLDAHSSAVFWVTDIVDIDDGSCERDLTDGYVGAEGVGYAAVFGVLITKWENPDRPPILRYRGKTIRQDGTAVRRYETLDGDVVTFPLG